MIVMIVMTTFIFLIYMHGWVCNELHIYVYIYSDSHFLVITFITEKILAKSNTYKGVTP